MPVPLYIIDNGGKWSDHVVYFVEDPGYTREQVEAFLRLCAGPDPLQPLKVLAHGEVEWFESKTMTFAKLADTYDWKLDNWNDEERFAGRVHAAQLPPALLELMPRFLKEQWYGGHSELEENKPETKPEEPNGA